MIYDLLKNPNHLKNIKLFLRKFEEFTNEDNYPEITSWGYGKTAKDMVSELRSLAEENSEGDNDLIQDFYDNLEEVYYGFFNMFPNSQHSERFLENGKFKRAYDGLKSKNAKEIESLADDFESAESEWEEVQSRFDMINLYSNTPEEEADRIRSEIEDFKRDIENLNIEDEDELREEEESIEEEIEKLEDILSNMDSERLDYIWERYDELSSDIDSEYDFFLNYMSKISSFMDDLANYTRNNIISDLDNSDFYSLYVDADFSKSLIKSSSENTNLAFVKMIKDIKNNKLSESIYKESGKSVIEIIEELKSITNEDDNLDMDMESMLSLMERIKYSNSNFEKTSFSRTFNGYYLMEEDKYFADNSKTYIVFEMSDGSFVMDDENNNLLLKLAKEEVEYKLRKNSKVFGEVKRLINIEEDFRFNVGALLSSIDKYIMYKTQYNEMEAFEVFRESKSIEDFVDFIDNNFNYIEAKICINKAFKGSRKEVFEEDEIGLIADILGEGVSKEELITSIKRIHFENSIYDENTKKLISTDSEGLYKGLEDYLKASKVNNEEFISLLEDSGLDYVIDNENTRIISKSNPGNFEGFKECYKNTSWCIRNSLSYYNSYVSGNKVQISITDFDSLGNDSVVGITLDTYSGSITNAHYKNDAALSGEDREKYLSYILKNAPNFFGLMGGLRASIKAGEENLIQFVSNYSGDLGSGISLNRDELMFFAKVASKEVNSGNEKFKELLEFMVESSNSYREGENSFINDILKSNISNEEVSDLITRDVKNKIKNKAS